MRIFHIYMLHLLHGSRLNVAPAKGCLLYLQNILDILFQAVHRQHDLKYKKKNILKIYDLKKLILVLGMNVQKLLF